MLIDVSKKSQHDQSKHLKHLLTLIFNFKLYGIKTQIQQQKTDNK